MAKPTSSPYLIPFDGSFKVKNAKTKPPKDVDGKKALKKVLKKEVEKLQELQRKLYAHDQYAVLLVFQAMDAAGKDGTIRAVMTGVNPAGCQVYSFKAPSSEDLDHDFLWRTSKALPERGRIGIFNRSYYEEVLAVRVHNEILKKQKLPTAKPGQIWKERMESIREHERHLARNGVVILKFWLNVSKEEQKNRLLARIEEPEANWKFSSQDVVVRKRWDDYMLAYQEALRGTSRSWAPWYAIPADDKPFMRVTVCKIIMETLENLPLAYPELAPKEKARLEEMREVLQAD